MTHNGPQWSDIGEKDVNRALDYLFGVFNLDELDDICASNSSKIALGPSWQDMDGEVAPVFLDRARALVTLGVFFEISVSQRLKRAGRGGVPLVCYQLDFCPPPPPQPSPLRACARFRG